VFNYLFGSLARIFTTLAEVDDPIILYGFVGSVALNVVLALQMLWYWNSGTKLGTATKKEKKFYTPGKSPNKPRASAGRRKA
jgi:mannose-P-dolichol utilization defect protein 1